MKNSIVVAGSVNADLVSFTGRFPEPGETVLGYGFSIYQGGKGANQAVAAARLGADVRMVGAVGKDFLGDFLIGELEKTGIETSTVSRVDGPSGVAAIRVDSGGENSIILNTGANDFVGSDFLDSAKIFFRDASYVLLQLEIPFDGVEKAVETAKRFGSKVILDPAPTRDLSDEFLEKIDFITPNEVEIEQIATGKTLEEMAGNLEKKGPRVVVKAGNKGVYVIEEGKLVNLPAFEVKAVDTTGAGDCFNAAFGVALSNGMEFLKACKFAMAASALSVTKKGAGASFPTRGDVDSFLKERA